MFDPEKKLGGEAEPKKHGATLIIGFSPNKRLGEAPEAEEDGSDEGSPKQRRKMACEILARLITNGRPDPGRLDQALDEWFKAREEEPHAEAGHDETEETGGEPEEG